MSASRQGTPGGTPSARALSWRNPAALLSHLPGLSRRNYEPLHIQAPPLPPSPTSWQALVSLCAAAAALLYAQRSDLSVAIIPMSAEYGWDPGWRGLVLSAFYAGVLCPTLAGGAVADRSGGRVQLAAGVALSALCAALTPPAAAWGRGALLAVRVAMGAAQGAAFPGVHSLVVRTVPPASQSSAVAAVTAASLAGTALAFGLAPAVLAVARWQLVFWAFATPALAWLPAWWLLRAPPSPVALSPLALGEAEGFVPGGSATGVPAGGAYQRSGAEARDSREATQSLPGSLRGGGAHWSAQMKPSLPPRPETARALHAQHSLASVSEGPGGGFSPHAVALWVKSWVPSPRAAWMAWGEDSRGVQDLGGQRANQDVGGQRANQDASRVSRLNPQYAVPSTLPLPPGPPPSSHAAPPPWLPPALDAGSEAGTEWSDGLAPAQRARLARVPTGFAALLRRREVWAIAVAQYGQSWAGSGLLSWLPSFFRERHDVKVPHLAEFALAPYLVQALVGALAGAAADRLLARGWSARRVRQSLQLAGTLLPAVCVLLASAARSPEGASAFVTLGLGCAGLATAGAAASHLDIAPKHAALVWATGASASTAAALLVGPVGGLVLQAWGSWAALLGLVAAHWTLSGAVFYVWAGGDVLLQDG